MNSPNRNLAIVKAVREQGEPVTRVAKRFRISRQRVYKILSQFDAGGADAIAPKSRAPHTHPQAVPTSLRNQIIDMRKQLVRSGLSENGASEKEKPRRQFVHDVATEVSTMSRLMTQRALGEIRTHDPWYRKPVLYPLSYEGAVLAVHFTFTSIRVESLALQ